MDIIKVSLISCISQLYIQESDRVFAINPTSYQQSLLIEEDDVNKSRIPWQPIPVSSKYLTF